MGWFVLVASVVATLSIAALGCGGTNLSESEVKNGLRHLPYRFKFRTVETPAGADAAIAGRAFGRYKTYIDFGISFGSEAEPVTVPRALTNEPEGFPAGEYVLTANVLIEDKYGKLATGKQIHNGRQWDEANHMVTDIEQTLCRMATGRPCPI